MVARRNVVSQDQSAADDRSNNQMEEALEEWRKRKMDRAKQRQKEKNGTVTSQA